MSFNDIYFMSLMFFISGLFVWRSLTHKGVGTFLRDRLIRLGIPFAVVVPFLIPLAFYAGQLEIGMVYRNSPGYLDFWLALARAGFGSSGPLWFLWLLLAFDCLAAVLYRVAPHLGSAIRAHTSAVFERPITFFWVLLGTSTAAYLPMGLVFGPMQWVGIGPFQVQASRVLLYLVYFLVGTAVGAYGFNRSMFVFNVTLARRWWRWLVAGLVSYLIMLSGVWYLVLSGMIGVLVFTVACATIGLGVTAFFLRFAKKRVGVLDSLSDNAYGIFLIHYPCVIWLQYCLLGMNLPAILKASIVFAGALVICWGLIAAIRRIPAVNRVI